MSITKDELIINKNISSEVDKKWIMQLLPKLPKRQVFYKRQIHFVIEPL